MLIGVIRVDMVHGVSDDLQDMVVGVKRVNVLVGLKRANVYSYLIDHPV